MQALKVFKTNQKLDTQPTGLEYSSLYGTRVQDEAISFGINDVYNIHAIYESFDNNDASSPYVVLTESVFFAAGTLIEGKTSGARGRVISFENSALKLFFVALNEKPFIIGETINGFDAAGGALAGIVDDGAGSIFKGSKVITDQFSLEAGQRTNYYDASRLTRLPSTIAPSRRLLIIFDYLSHESSGDYFSNESYTELALYARINEKGKLELINELDIYLGNEPEEILKNLEDKKYEEEDIIHSKKLLQIIYILK